MQNETDTLEQGVIIKNTVDGVAVEPEKKLSVPVSRSLW